MGSAIDNIRNVITKARALLISPDHNSYLEYASACTNCHDAQANPQEGSDPFTLNVPYFVHEIHLKAKTPDPVLCTTCHLTEEGKSFEPPSKQVCGSCHPDQHSITGTNCTACHERPGNEAAPHSGDWIKQHGTAVNIPREQCFECHSGGDIKECADCHSSPSLSPAPHETGNNYRVYLHKLDAKKKTVDCYSCHERQSFCADCHSSFERIPESHFSSGFEQTHGRMAEQDPEYCASCHGMGQTCWNCHPNGINK